MEENQSMSLENFFDAHLFPEKGLSFQWRLTLCNFDVV
jgi:hypothetical protein